MKHFYFSPLLLLLFTVTELYAQVDYQQDIQPIFNARCVSCHGGTSGVFLQNYDAVMNSVGNQYQQNIVIPEEPEESPLYDKLLPNPEFGNRMPTGGSLTDEQIALIYDWIKEGALEAPAVAVGSSEHPAEFTLKNNYPNPFNPSTNIRFTLPASANWVVTVYNLNGAQLLQYSGQSAGGLNTVTVNMNDFASGIYIYTVEARTTGTTLERQSGKMLLVK